MTHERLQSGIPGLDAILGGGFIRRGLYLVVGAPGVGKTTASLQFLLEGVRRGEPCLYLALSETREQTSALADSFGWDLGGVVIHDVLRDADGGIELSRSEVFSPAEIELEEIERDVVAQVEQVKPVRLVVDSLSEIRLLTEDAFHYRRALVRLSDRIAEHACTVLATDVEAEGRHGLVMETLASGVLHLEQLSPLYGGSRRRVRIRKMRGSAVMGGYHDMAIKDGGLEIFPRLVAAAHRGQHSSDAMPSGIRGLDDMLCGGIDRGTSTALMGPAGTGKSSIAAQFLAKGASREEMGVVLCFDESPTNFLVRAHGLGIPLQKHVDAGRIHISAVDPAEFSPGEIAQRLREKVDEGARLVLIDSLNGYMNAMPEEHFLAAHMHELLAYLSEKGVGTLLTLTQRGFLGPSEARFDISYLADSVVLLRYFEVAGEVRQAISVVKKRTGAHGRSIRELSMSNKGIHVGEPLRDFQGLLSGNLQPLRSHVPKSQRNTKASKHRRS